MANTLSNEQVVELSNMLADFRKELAEYPEYDEFVDNVASGGNHNDTFSAGETYGNLEGSIYVLETALAMIASDEEDRV